MRIYIYIAESEKKKKKLYSPELKSPLPVVEEKDDNSLQKKKKTPGSRRS